jgi:hypothetical protein
MPPFRDLLRDVELNPSKWKVVKTQDTPSTNIRNKGGMSRQELLRNEETGEEIVRHSLFKPDGSLFDKPHYRDSWK